MCKIIKVFIENEAQNFWTDNPSDPWTQVFHLAPVSFRSVKVGFDSNKESKVDEENPEFWALRTRLFVVDLAEIWNVCSPHPYQQACKIW